MRMSHVLPCRGKKSTFLAISSEAKRGREICLRLRRAFHLRPDPSTTLGVTRNFGLPLADARHFEVSVPAEGER